MSDDHQHIVKINSSILCVYQPVVVLLGLCLNLLSIIVWSRQLNRLPVAVFLFALSILDTVGLFSEPFSHWLYAWFRDQHRHGTLDHCWVFNMIQNFVNLCSGWIIFFICFIQACKLIVPERVIISKQKAMFIVLLITMFSIGLNQHFTVYKDFKTPRNKDISPFLRCSDLSNVSLSASFWHSMEWNWVDNLAGCLFPVTMIIACLIAIVQVQRVHNKYHDEEPLIVRQVRFRRLPRLQRDLNKIAVVFGITHILSIVPITIYRVEVPEIQTVGQELAITALSILGHVNIATKFIYSYTCCIAFRKCAAKFLNDCSTGKCLSQNENQISADGSIQLEIAAFGESTDASSPSRP